MAARCEAAQLAGSQESQMHGEMAQAACFEAAALQQRYFGRPRTLAPQNKKTYCRGENGWCSTWSRFSRPRFVLEACMAVKQRLWKVLQQRNERLLQSLAFHGMIMSRSHSQAGDRFLALLSIFRCCGR